MQVLYDRTFVSMDKQKEGVFVDLNIPLRRTMTFEEHGSGASAVGAGNTYLMITSNQQYTVTDPKSVGVYKSLA